LVITGGVAGAGKVVVGEDDVLGAATADVLRAAAA
jgi:hypothetical protein